jgi:diguanylate cyclase (GGDEF)-like protein
MVQVMLFRSAVLAVVLGLAALPGVAMAAASDAPSVDPAGVSALAMNATELLAEEQALLGAVTELSGPPSPDVDVRLRSVDTRGIALLTELQRQGVEMSDATVMALSRLPLRGEGFPPSGVVYDAAIADLARIATTPSAALPAEPGNSGPALGLLAVAAMSLLILGAAALGNTLRRRESDEELAAMAWSDGLTGLANRRRFDHDVAAYDNTMQPVSAIMIDVDHFKNVNDTFGHQEGDEVLRRVASMLADYVRFDDVVYRYGGEEFCILLPGATHDDAIAVGERIVVAAHAIRLPDGSNLTVSVGVAHTDTSTASQSCQSADEALLAAKEHGRDRAVDAATLDNELGNELEPI